MRGLLTIIGVGLLAACTAAGSAELGPPSQAGGASGAGAEGGSSRGGTAGGGAAAGVAGSAGSGGSPGGGGAGGGGGAAGTGTPPCAFPLRVELGETGLSGPAEAFAWFDFQPGSCTLRGEPPPSSGALLVFHQTPAQHSASVQRDGWRLSSPDAEWDVPALAEVTLSLESLTTAETLDVTLRIDSGDDIHGEITILAVEAGP